MSEQDEHNQNKIIPTADRSEYVPTQWVNDVTRLNQRNMNHIEAGIIKAVELSLENSGFVDEIESAINQNMNVTFDQSNNTLTIQVGTKATEENPTRFYFKKTITIEPGYDHLNNVYESKVDASSKLNEAKSYARDLVENSMKVSGSVESIDDLPANPTVGDTYNILGTGDNYTWNGSFWDKQAGELVAGPGVSITDNTISALTTATNVIINIDD